MKKILVGLLLSLTGMMGAQTVGAIEPLPRDLEIKVALSSLPPHLRDEATVYVLNPTQGFEVVRRGTNGFHAFVARTSPYAFRGAWAFTTYPEDILVPIAFDSAGVKANMQVFFDVEEMRAKGVAPQNVKKTIVERYRTHFYKAPERVGISYMLSPVLRAYYNPDQSDAVGTFNAPHYMFYAPNVTDQDIGGVPPPTSHPSAFRTGLHGYINLQAGEKEIADINKEYEGMLAELCDIKETWCLPK